MARIWGRLKAVSYTHLENGDGGVPDDIIVIDPESEVRHEVAQQIA